MKHTLITLALLAFSVPAAAQHVVGSGGTKPAPLAPDLIMPAGKMFVDRTTIPPSRTAYNVPRAKLNCVGANPVPCSDSSNPKRTADTYNGGSFRVICDRSHLNFDDPIVWETQSGRTHLHTFWGNTLTGAAADPDNQAVAGQSTCFGGTLNRSGYWAPTVLYSCPAGEGAIYGCNEARHGEVQVAEENDIYYKRAAQFHSSSANFDGSAGQWPPVGFRMIVGTTSGVAMPPGTNWYECFRNGSIAQAFPNARYIGNIPTTANGTANGGCTEILMLVGFPECWDGVNDGSTGDHMSHMVEQDHYAGCDTAGHPISFPQITYNVFIPINNADLDHLRLSSDMTRTQAVAEYGISGTITPGVCLAANNYCAGRALHADWVNGWSSAANGGVGYPWGGLSITQLIERECYMQSNSELSPIHSDCHNNNFGDPLGDLNWWRLF